MRLCPTLRAALLLIGFRAACASKDAHYFTPGTSNPNVDKSMYWRDAVNVLQDLDQFQYLYVSFHSCAWSLFGNGQQIMNCGGNGGEMSNWYMGHTACFRANAAFELYGVLKEDYGGSGEDDGCGKATYINSFFTFMGVESFQQAIKLAGVDFQVDDYAGDDWLVDDGAFKRHLEEGGEGEGDDRYQAPDDLFPVSSYCYQRTPDDDAYVNVEYNDDENQDHGSRHYTFEKFSSYGIGCLDSNYARKTYTGAFCDGNSVVEVTDKLSNFNSQIQSMQCIKIYDGDDYEEPDYDDEYLARFRQNGNAEESNSGDNEDSSYSIELYDSVDLLRFSRACNVLEYPSMCSDPYGLSAKYRNSLYRSTRLKHHSTGTRPRTALSSFAWFVMVVGALLLTGACLIKERILQIPQGSKKNRDLDPNSPNFAADALQTVGSTISSTASSISGASRRMAGKLRDFAEATEQVPVDSGGSSSREVAMAVAGGAVVAGGATAVASSKKQRSPARAMLKKFSKGHNSPIRGGVKISVQTSTDMEDFPDETDTAIYSYREHGPEKIGKVVDKPLSKQNKEVANTMLADASKTKFKRPRLAKASRSLFGRSSRSNP